MNARKPKFSDDGLELISTVNWVTSIKYSSICRVSHSVLLQTLESIVLSSITSLSLLSYASTSFIVYGVCVVTRLVQSGCLLDSKTKNFF